jgi:MoxR-like ATPase
VNVAAHDPDLAGLGKLKQARDLLREQIARVVVGQDEVIDQLMISIFARGHCILEGVPGLAKTLMVSTLADCLALNFTRIQFTPDLMPSDITGTEVLQEDRATGTRHLRYVRGPVFTNVLLADEINRTPPKTQAALLEAMQERQVSAGGHRHPLPDPFFVLATQNPIEQEGTYPLPEAQLDRFLFMIQVGYPSGDEEEKIMRQGTAEHSPQVNKVLKAEEIITLQNLVRRVPVSDHVFQYAKKLVRMTRPGTPDAADFANKWLLWGAGPRASMNLILAAKARAILRGQFHVSPEDVAAMAGPILRHRLVPNFAAQSESITTDVIVKKLLEAVPKLG